ncbi:MAG: four helix bundle protein [Anaerolineales bacterium]|nr:four helix bundle protein [Anaerolineales bacterium]
MYKFRELKVWQRAMNFVTDIYRDSASFPNTERLGLTSQMRRAAISIPLNVAEDAGANSGGEFQRFLSYALRPTYEVMSTLEIAQRLGYSTPKKTQGLLKQADEIAAMFVGLSRNLV